MEKFQNLSPVCTLLETTVNDGEGNEVSYEKKGQKKKKQKQTRKMSIISVDSLCLNSYFVSAVSVGSSFLTFQSLF